VRISFEKSFFDIEEGAMSAGMAHRVREQFLPYCLPMIGEEEIAEVVDSLRSGWVTTGPKVKRFEQAFAGYVGSDHAIAVGSCTAALHLSLAALGIGPGDEVILPTMTFCSTANVVVHLGATPVLVDIDDSMLMDTDAAERAITTKTKAIVPVHYGGQACDLDAAADLARRYGLFLVEDAAHAAGCEYRGRRVGTHGDAVAFSFYATKNMTTGEGGMITTNDGELAARMRRLSLHGMSRDAWNRYSETGTWYYEVLEAGFKANMTDIQASLGIHQLKKLNGFISRRREIAQQYGEAFADLPELILPRELPNRNHVYHLYPLQLNPRRIGIDRSAFVTALHDAGIGASVHFIPVHLHPFYQTTFRYHEGSCPKAEKIYEHLLSLPLYPRMVDRDVQDVIEAVRQIAIDNRRFSI
jgi:dTDP-4-amino-4,6-dideoxygalactose transaminase